MNLRDGLRQKSMELRGDSLRSRQRQHTSNYEVELDSGPHFQEDQRMEIHLPNMNGQSGQRQRQPTNGMKNSDPHADMPRSTSPLNEHYMPSPRTRRHDVNDSMASPREARSEEPSGISGSAGLLRLSGRQGWTASSWQMGSAKPQTVIPETVGPIQFPPPLVGSQGVSPSYSPRGGTSAPRSMTNGSDRKLSVTNTVTPDDQRGAKGQMRGAQIQAETPQGLLESNSNLSKEWINMELERLKSEYQFKSQIATMLRSTLAGMKTQHAASPRQSNPQGWTGLVPQSQSLVHQDGQLLSPKRAPGANWNGDQHSSMTVHPSGELEAIKSEADERKRDITHLESDIAALEAHVKLLSDALDDERQDNQDLSEENVILKAQVEKLTTAGEKLLKGMTLMRGAQEP